MKLLNRGLSATYTILQVAWMPTGICTSMQLFASRSVWFQAKPCSIWTLQPIERIGWSAMLILRTQELDEINRNQAITLNCLEYPWITLNYLESPWKGLAQPSRGSWCEGPPVENCESIECSVLDALDEVQLHWTCYQLPIQLKLRSGM